MTLRSDLTTLFADAGLVDVDIDKAIQDEHVRLSYYHKVLAAIVAEQRRDNDRAVVAMILRDHDGSVTKTAVVELVDGIAMKTRNPTDFRRWAAELMPEIDQLMDGYRQFLHRRIQDWTIYLLIVTGYIPTAVEMAGATDWMQRRIASESTSLPVLAILTEIGSTRRIRNIARDRAAKNERGHT